MREKKTSINEDYIEDFRLQPLTINSSKVVLQLYVVQITINKIKSYKILYGYCILTTRPNISNDINISDFQKIHSANDISYEVAKISIYNYSEIIIKLVNGLLSGKSFKISASNCNLNTERLKYDFILKSVDDETYVVRPIIFNETNSNVSRNLYEKYSLNSPYGNTPSFSLIVANLNKLSIFRNIKDEYYDGYKESLLALLNFLSDETGMRFSTTECARFGNIEFINTQCANIYEAPYVYFENIKSEEAVDGFKEITSKQVKVTILQNSVTDSKKLLVNCFSRNGGQVILDEIKEVYHQNGETLEIIFNTSEPLSDLVVSAWIEDGDKWQIWFKNTAILVKSIVTNIGVISRTGIVTSAYLEKIESSSSHLKAEVEKAKEINKASYQKMLIGDNRLDPWVSADYNFNLLVGSLVPDKSNAAFFPRGWNVEQNEHGALAFLEWFKTICDKANNVIIQDPFFDIVGLEFLARTTNSDTSFSIITCTQISSYDDKTSPLTLFNRVKKFFGFYTPIPKSKTPNRASRIINLLKSTPGIYSYLKLKVHDYRSTTGNDKNLLHDRYILIYENGEAIKGFHLSNSIQGATQNHPLLITPISQDIIPKIERYSIELINEGKKNNDFEMVTLYDYLDKPKEFEPKKNSENIDKELFDKLKETISKDVEIEPNYVKIEEIVKEKINDDFKSFVKFWDTFSVFMANTSSGDVIADKVKNWILPKYNLHFKNHLITIALDNNSNNFNDKHRLERSNFHILFQDDFDKAIIDSFNVGNYLFENFGFGSYSAGYASNVLISMNIASFIDVVAVVCAEVKKRKNKEDLSEKPILKIAAILFHDLAVELFWHTNDNTINKCLQSPFISLRAMAIGAIVNNTIENKNDMNFESAEQYFDLLSFDESIKAYVSLLHKTRNNDVEKVKLLQGKCFKKLAKLLNGKDKALIFSTIDRIIIKSFNLIEALVTNNLMLPLLEDKSITIQDIHVFWKQKFEIAYEESEIMGKNNGLFDINGWSIYASDDSDRKKFINFLDRTTKTNLAKIRKPFKRGSSEWETANNRLLMIQTILMITALYFPNFEPKIDSGDFFVIKRIIDEIETIKKNYPYFRDYNDFHNFNKQITDKYIIKCSTCKIWIVKP